MNSSLDPQTPIVPNSTQIDTQRMLKRFHDEGVQLEEVNMANDEGIENDESIINTIETENQDGASVDSKGFSTNQTEAFRQWIEGEVLKIIQQQLQNVDVPEARIQELANRALDLVKPGMNLEELFQSAIKLNDGFREFDPVVIKLMKEYEQKFKKKALERVSSLVHHGKYDEAQDVVKKVLQFKMM